MVINMLGTIVNTIAVIIGATIGMLLKKGLSDKMADTLMKGLGLRRREVSVRFWSPAAFPSGIRSRSCRSFRK